MKRWQDEKSKWRNGIAMAACAAMVTMCGCVGPYGRSGEELRRRGDEIVVCGRLFHTGTRVVLWDDPGGFDAYRAYRRFSATGQTRPSHPTEGTDTPNRYSPVRGGLSDEMARRVNERGWALEDLQQVVEQFVIHYDVAGTSRRCFEVLQDVRGLSVHFMLDIDGTIYQTLDLKERARHAGTANDRSVGVEIAQMGAYAKAEELKQWYETDADGGVRLKIPAGWRPIDGKAMAVLRPARNEMICGWINGSKLYQYDFTAEQYEALAHLAATLARVFPRMELSVPRDAGAYCAVPYAPPLGIEWLGWRHTPPGPVTRDALNDQQLREYRGLLGHYHVTREKLDPGPAFDWERVLKDAAALRR